MAGPLDILNQIITQMQQPRQGGTQGATQGDPLGAMIAATNGFSRAGPVAQSSSGSNPLASLGRGLSNLLGLGSVINPTASTPLVSPTLGGAPQQDVFEGNSRERSEQGRVNDYFNWRTFLQKMGPHL